MENASCRFPTSAEKLLTHFPAHSWQSENAKQYIRNVKRLHEICVTRPFRNELLCRLFNNVGLCRMEIVQTYLLWFTREKCFLWMELYEKRQVSQIYDDEIKIIENPFYEQSYALLYSILCQMRFIGKNVRKKLIKTMWLYEESEFSIICKIR